MQAWPAGEPARRALLGGGMGEEGGTEEEEPPEASALFPGGAFIITFEAFRKSNTSLIPSNNPIISMVKFLWREKTKREQAYAGTVTSSPVGRSRPLAPTSSRFKSQACVPGAVWLGHFSDLTEPQSPHI